MKKIFTILFLIVILLSGRPVLAINCTDCSDSCKDSDNFPNCYNNCLSSCTNTETAADTSADDLTDEEIDQLIDDLNAETGASADVSNNNGVTIQNPLGRDMSIPQLANNLISVVLGLSGVLALIAFIYGGTLYLLAGIDANNVKKGKEIMKWAIIGLFLIFSSYAIVNFVLASVLGIK